LASRTRLHHRHVHPLQRQTIRRFTARAAAADHHGALPVFGGNQHFLDIVYAAIRQHAGQIDAGYPSAMIGLDPVAIST